MVDLATLKKNWDALGREDPMWAILSDPAQRGNKWDREAFFRTGLIHVAEVMAQLDELGVFLARDRALDFGCGVGRLTQALAGTFERVDGIDIAPSMIEGARKYNSCGDRVEYHLNDLDDLQLFPDDTFDFVLSLIVLQHIENRYKTKYLCEFLRVIRPGGAAVFTIPSQVSSLNLQGVVFASVPNRLLNLYRRKRYGYSGVMELHPMHRDEVESVATAAGGTVVDVQNEPLAGPAWCSFRYTVVKPA